MPSRFLSLATSHKEKPDVLVGLTSALGTPLELTASVLQECLDHRNYDCNLIKLSGLASALNVRTPAAPDGADEYSRIRALMDRGNEARQMTGENSVLAALAISKIIEKRSKLDPNDERGHAFLLRQLKHPDEAYLLRKVYEEGFHLVGVHCPPAVRLQQLQVQKGMRYEEAKRLIEDDEYEGLDHGQKVRDTFHLSDVFVRATGDASDSIDVKQQISRFFELLFGDGIRTPTLEEYGMFLAWASGLRSAQLSRQVGAAILSPSGEVLSVGTNEVPKGGGGQYWENDSPDGRDHTDPRGDSTDYMRREVLAEVLSELVPKWKDKNDQQRTEIVLKYSTKLKNTRVMNLTEFGRAVHAEMEAISAAARVGTSVRGAHLFTTTFPCHNCTKHIVAAGIARVVYIEPYPKSLARDLHSDAITIDEDRRPCGGGPVSKGKVNFEAFVGVAPRRYADLFSMATPEGRIIRRKDPLGRPDPDAPGLRINVKDYSYKQIEDRVMVVVDAILPKTDSKQ